MALNTPMQNTGSSNAPIAKNQTNIVKNALSPLGELKVKITVDGTTTAVNVMVIPGPCPGKVATSQATTEVDQTHVVLTSSVTTGNNNATYTEFKNYLAFVGMYFSYLRLNTDDADNWGSSIFMAELAPNGNINPQEVPLSDYRTTLGGGGYDKTLTISNKHFVNTKNFSLWMSNIKSSTYVEFCFGIAAIADSVTVTGQ